MTYGNNKGHIGTKFQNYNSLMNHFFDYEKYIEKLPT